MFEEKIGLFYITRETCEAVAVYPNPHAPGGPEYALINERLHNQDGLSLDPYVVKFETPAEAAVWWEHSGYERIGII